MFRNIRTAALVVVLTLISSGWALAQNRDDDDNYRGPERQYQQNRNHDNDHEKDHDRDHDRYRDNNRYRNNNGYSRNQNGYYGQHGDGDADDQGHRRDGNSGYGHPVYRNDPY